MIVWLASYPRSGNTLLRVILHQAFGLNTYSCYDDAHDIASTPRLAELTGHVSHGRSMHAFVDEARGSRETYFVKTHRLPSDDLPAIYVIRDGRAATISLWHYRRDFFGPKSLREIVLGHGLSAAWSDHVAAWGAGRPKTLLLRFEQLAAGDAATIAAIGNFLKLQQTGAASISFDDLRRTNPKFFRSGSNEENIAELEARCSELFWLRNGPAMVSFGYASEDPFASLSPEHRKRLCEEMLTAEHSARSA